MSSVQQDVAAVIPALDEQDRIAATVRAARALPGVGTVVVVDDGSADGTADAARQAGAQVVRHARNRGKAAAMTTGADRVAGSTRPGSALLFIDADLGDSAANTAPLIGPVLVGEVDMTIAILPTQQTPGGGHGLVVNLSRSGIFTLTGWTATQPLSGMRCLSRAAFDTARPLARGWGVETGLSIDLLRAGCRVLEVPCDLQHRVTGRDWRSQRHRAEQYRDVWLALAARRLPFRR